MIPARLAPVAFGLVLSCLMSLVISGVSTLRALGPVAEMPGVWMGAWLFSWAVAFPTVLFVAPLARRIVGRLTATPLQPQE